MIVDRRGATRIVVLAGGYAFKFPMLGFGIKAFIVGMLANLNENQWRMTSEHAPRTIYCNIFGFILIAKRCRPVRHRGLFYVSLAEIIAKSDISSEFWLSDCKPENFGYIGSVLVKLDAGS